MKIMGNLAIGTISALEREGESGGCVWRPHKHSAFPNNQHPFAVSKAIMALPMQKGSLGLLLSLFILFLALIYPPPSSTEFDSFLEPSSPRTALILTAHPDDEAMFFSPTILSLVASGWDVRALCMSLGGFSCQNR